MIGRTRDAYLAVRNSGGRAMTLDELAALLPADTGPRQLGPVVWHLCQLGWLVVLPGSPWWARRYGVSRLWAGFHV